MNELSKEKTMTIKEVASVLNYDESTIRKIGKDLFPEKFRNGIRTDLNEMQVTAIKYQLGKKSEVKTGLEKKLLIKQGYDLLMEEISSLQQQNEIMKPKALFYDQVTGSDNTLDMQEVAKVLNMGIGRNNLFALLRKKKVLDKKNQPYQTYVDRGYFRVIESEYEQNGHIQISLKTVVFQKGIDYIKKVIESSREGY